MRAAQTGEGEQKEDLKITVNSKGKQPARESTVFLCTPTERATLPIYTGSSVGVI